VMPVPFGDYTAVPVAGTASLAQASSGTAVAIVRGHGAANGGDEYKHTTDTLMLNGNVVGSFSTMVDCKRYRQYSPDGNPFIFLNNKTNNPRNWCPGALVAARAFKVNLLSEKPSVRAWMTRGYLRGLTTGPPSPCCPTEGPSLRQRRMRIAAFGAALLRVEQSRRCACSKLQALKIYLLSSYVT
jgi:hypothetical protein